MNAHQREKLIQDVERQRKRRKQVLKNLGIPRATYYKWRKDYVLAGVDGLIKNKTVARRIWNRLMPGEQQRILRVARRHPELSPRLLAIKIIDEESFSVSETTAYRLLKRRGLINPRPLPELPAAKQWHKKMTGPDEIWQCDATRLFVVDWGYYNLIPVEDDYSRKILGYDLKPDETAFSIADAIEIAIENAKAKGHIINERPQLYSDNGSGFISQVMAEYLEAHGIRHIFGKPYHPQGRGKIERFNRSIKEKLCLVVYCSPDELKKATDKAIADYNATPHESLKNVSPNNVYAGKKEVILEKRREKKRLTIEARKKYNLTQPSCPI